jgi:[ribosomal protein S5]-alanine N-acetyltransferase
VPELQRLHAGHADAILAFERANRAYFAASIPDRGDAFFEHYAEQHAEWLADQETGECAFYVLVGDSGEVLGRFNLVDVAGGAAELGYRVAEKAAGQGVATAAVREICQVAADRHGVVWLRAATTTGNAASRRVLAKAGFVPDGETTLGGQPGLRFLRNLRPGCTAVPWEA